MLENLKYEVVRFLCNVQIQRQDEIEELERRRAEEASKKQMQFQHAQASAMEAGEPEAEAGEQEGAANPEPYVRGERKVGRNEPCPCGSGKKYKHCHGKLS